jgi:prepilin-type N-terminal cleavage/methylation domain-containing protein
MNSFRRNKTGFTLIEVIVVIAIIGLLSSIIIVAVRSVRDNAGVASGKTFAGHSRTALYDNTIAYLDFDRNDASILGTIGGNASINSNFTSIVADSTLFNRGFYFQADPYNPVGGATAIGISNSQISSTVATLTSSFTYMTWYKPSSMPGAVIIGFDTSGNLNCHNLWLSNTGLLSAGYIAGTCPASARISATTPIKNNSWSHIAVSVKNISSGNSEIKIFLNGKEIASGNQTYGVSAGVNYMGISGQCCNRAPGIYDNIGLYSRSLMASEVYDLYASQAPKYGMFKPGNIIDS